MRSTIIPNHPEAVNTLTTLGCRVSEPRTYFMLGDMYTPHPHDSQSDRSDRQPFFLQTSPDSGIRRECTIPADWSIEEVSPLGCVLVDSTGCVVARVTLPYKGTDEYVDFSHMGKRYGNATLFRVREMIADIQLDRVGLKTDLLIEINNGLRDVPSDKSSVASELREILAVL